MSELNVLNPSSLSLYSPDYGYEESPLQRDIAVFQPRFGPQIERTISGRGRMFRLQWKRRPASVKSYLQQWAEQYRGLGKWFTWADWEMGRFYSGRFAGPLKFTLQGNAAWDIEGMFEELQGLALYEYPTNWDRDAIFIEERDDDGNALVKLTGTWALQTVASAHAGGHYYSNTLDDSAEWLYFGYGFRVWASADGNRGIMGVSVDGGAESNVDLYGVLADAGVVYTNTNLPLGQHRVKLRVTHTKNAASTDYYCIADAIEVML